MMLLRDTTMNINSVDQAVTLLNTLLRVDPEQISNFFNLNIFVDRRCADSVFEMGPSSYKKSAVLYPIGIINGFVSEYDHNGRIVRRIGVKYKQDSPVIDSFFVDDLRDRDAFNPKES
jgi:hypothetical protein